jgi:phosphoenolpyruvate-protein kinase (PTS system EI component)
MSANPFFAILLMGLGFSEFSMNAFAIPTIRRAIQGLRSETVGEIAQRALCMNSAAEIAKYLLESVSAAVDIDLSGFTRELLSSGNSTSST